MFDGYSKLPLASAAIPQRGSVAAGSGLYFFFASFSSTFSVE